MSVCIYPGTFDPITNGHLDVLERACRMFEHVIVAIADSKEKRPCFSIEERLALVEKNTAINEKVSVTHFDGLLIDFVKSQNANVIIRGLRAVSDFEFEFQMALMNRQLGPEIETILVMTKEGYNYTSSSLVKQVAQFGGDVSKFVPKNVVEALKTKFTEKPS